MSRVWILADLFGDEANYVRPGDKVKVTLADQDETYMATVSEILPEFDPATLTVKVRLEVDNPQFVLRPGMFVDVEVPVNMPPAVNVPVDAIMDSGLKQTVFVDRGDGYFSPRQVETGWRLGDRVQIVRGLDPGERIVISGNFLIDSESRMKLAAAGFFGNVVKDPVCGMNVDDGKARTAGLKSEYQGKSYYFCSDTCQQQFEKTPERYVSKPEESSASGRVESSPEVRAAPQKTRDLVCGYELDEARAKAAGLTSTYKGKTYYFCSYGCNKQFDKDPERYLQQEARGGAAVSRRRLFPERPKTRCAACRLQRVGPNRQAGPANTRENFITLIPTDANKGLTTTLNIIYPEARRTHCLTPFLKCRRILICC